MEFAEGMQAALEAAERFATDDEAAAFWNADTDPAAFREVVVPGAAGQPQTARLYPAKVGAPTLLYIHGGGWTGGSVALNHASACGLAAESGWNVLGISYRLAPRHPYPAGLDDCQAALDWVRAEGPAHGLDAERIAVGGASAGANLALALALRLPPDTFEGLLLFYGVLGADLSTPSYLAYRDGPGLTRARMAELFEMYDPEGYRTCDPLIAPILSDRLPGMPASCLIAAEHDVLLDDSRMMAEALRRAGVPTDFHIEPGVTHGFINRGRLVPAANVCIARAARFLSKLAEK